MAMTHDEVQELLGVYALDAVEPDEVTAIELHLLECARCRAEVAEHRETAAMLAHAGADAPPALWDRIAGSIEPPATVVTLPPRLGGEVARPTAIRRRPVWLAPVAAAAAVVIAVLGLQVRELQQRIDELPASATAELAAAAADPDAVLVHLDGASGASVPVVVNGDQAWLDAATLPDAGNGRTYQLWGAAGDELVSVAVLGRTPGVVTFDVTGYAALAITEEAAPGVVTSAQTPVVIGELA
jgi:hypothetical protein